MSVVCEKKVERGGEVKTERERVREEKERNRSNTVTVIFSDALLGSKALLNITKI